MPRVLLNEGNMSIFLIMISVKIVLVPMSFYSDTDDMTFEKFGVLGGFFIDFKCTYLTSMFNFVKTCQQEAPGHLIKSSWIIKLKIL